MSSLIDGDLIDAMNSLAKDGYFSDPQKAGKPLEQFLNKNDSRLEAIHAFQARLKLAEYINSIRSANRIYKYFNVNSINNPYAQAYIMFLYRASIHDVQLVTGLNKNELGDNPIRNHRLGKGAGKDIRSIENLIKKIPSGRLQGMAKIGEQAMKRRQNKRLLKKRGLDRMDNRYNKVLKIADKYLKVSSPSPVLLGRKLSNDILKMEDIYDAFGPKNFSFAPLEEATIFTKTQALLICKSYEIAMNRKGQKIYIEPEIVELGNSQLSLKRQLNNIREIHIQTHIDTSSTNDFDTIDRFESLKENTVNPHVEWVDVDLEKYTVERITIQTKDMNYFLANVINVKNSRVEILTQDKRVPFAVDVKDKQTGDIIQLGSFL